MGNVASDEIRRPNAMAARASPSLRWQNTDRVEKSSCSCISAGVSHLQTFRHERVLRTDFPNLDDVFGLESPLLSGIPIVCHSKNKSHDISIGLSVYRQTGPIVFPIATYQKDLDYFRPWECMMGQNQTHNSKPVRDY